MRKPLLPLQNVGQDQSVGSTSFVSYKFLLEVTEMLINPHSDVNLHTPQDANATYSISGG